MFVAGVLIFVVEGQPRDVDKVTRLSILESGDGIVFVITGRVELAIP